MATTFVAKATATGNWGTPSVTIPASVAEGDTLYLFASCDWYGGGVGEASTPTGWTKLGSSFNSTTETGTVFTKTATAGDASSAVTTSWNFNHRWGMSVWAYRGDPLEGAEWRNGISPLTVPVSVTAGDVVLAFLWCPAPLDASQFGQPYTLSDFNEPAQYYAFGVSSTTSAPSNATELEFTANESLAGDNERVFAFVVASAGAIPEEEPEPAFPGAAEATDRLRSRVSEDTGSVLDSVEARVVDASLSVDFTNAVTLEPLGLTNFRDALRETDSATVDATFYPRPVQNTSEEQQFDGITLLSRLASWYPPPIFDTVTNLGIVSSGTATAQQVIQHVLDEWATAADWFTSEAAPDLRLRINGYAPSDYTATDGLVLCETVTIAQDGENRRTARQILDDLLSPFPSTIVRQNSSGNLEIVPVYGPDADETAFLTLSNDDVYSVSQGKPDPWLIKNRATATCTGYSRQEEVEVMQPAWFQVGSNYQLGKATWYAPPSDRLNLQPPPDGFDTLQESLSSGEFGQQRPALWPRSTSNIPAGTGISLQDGGSAATITAAWSRYDDTSLQASGSGTLTLIETEVPFDGAWRPTFRWDEGSQYVVMGCRWNAARGGVELAINSAFLESGCVTGCKGWVVEFTLNDSSVGYATGVRKSATFGVIDDANPDQSDTLPSSTGNAIEESQTAYGVLEATINIRGYDLDVGTLREIATAFVVENITPRVTRDLDVSTWGVGVTFDAIGRLIELPSGEQGVLTSVEYGDDFTAKTLRRTARVQLKNGTATGALDTTSTLYTTTKSGNDYLATTAGEIYKTTG